MDHFNINNLVTALATVGAAAVAGAFAWLAARGGKKQADNEAKRKSVEVRYQKALHQIESYHTLEGLYAAELEMLSGGRDKATKIKTEFRNRVETAGLIRPTMTALEARAAIVEAGAPTG